MTFIADTATYDVIDGAPVTGLAIGNGGRGYFRLMFQRSEDIDSDDLGVYVELNDQSNSGIT